MAYEKLKQMQSKIPQWIEKGFSSRDDIDLIEEFGKYLADTISTSQIRIAYGEITRLKMQFNESELLMLRPKIAYAAARGKNAKYRELQSALTTAINTVSESADKETAFNNLASFFEATLAYHKAYGGN